MSHFLLAVKFFPMISFLIYLVRGHRGKKPGKLHKSEEKSQIWAKSKRTCIDILATRKRRSSEKRYIYIPK